MVNPQIHYGLRLTSFAARNFRSLCDVQVEDLPPVVLLYGENDTGKSNLIQAVGVWLRIVQALALATPKLLKRRDFSERDFEFGLYETYEPDWSDKAPPDAPSASEILGPHPEALFRYGSDQFELEGELSLTALSSDERRYRFGFRVSREYGGQFHCTVLTAIWPDGRKPDKPLALDEMLLNKDVEALRQALQNPWQQIGAERRFDDEWLPREPTDEQDRPLDPTGRNLKLWLFRAASGFEADRRKLFRERFAPLLTRQPFALPEPLPVVAADGKLELLLGDYPVEHRGSGPQQWVLMAGLLAMSQAAVAGLEEPEAHLSWEAQQQVAETLRNLVLDQSCPPYQLFVSGHSQLMLDICPTDTVYYKTTLQNGETRIERSVDLEEIQARFAMPPISDLRPRRLLAANLVRLSEDAVQHLNATVGEKLFEAKEKDGSLRLVTAKWMDDYLSGNMGRDGNERKDD
ncbi:MAG: AAA family ATPase [Candidatus Contendobacter sp.]|nr:AAA family ATPase [Candidatus Contendobacter sp.]